MRVGLGPIKGLPKVDLSRLLDARSEGGPFADPIDVQTRAKISGKAMELFALSGAFDRWTKNGDRTLLLWDSVGGLPRGVKARPTDAFQRAEQELELLGVTLEIHPAALTRAQQFSQDYPHRISQVPHRLGVLCRFWALVVAEKLALTKDGHPMQFVTLEDETGLLETVVFPDAFKKRGSPFAVGEVVPATGVAELQDGVCILRWEL